MKITQQIVTQLGHYPLTRWHEETWKSVDECRQTVGYQPGKEWECAGCGGTKEQCDALSVKYPGKYVCGGFLCPACVVKEIKDWESAGLIPTTAEN